MLTNSEIETYYYRLLNDFIRNEVNLSKISSSLNYLRNNIDCTVYIEVEKTQRVNFK